MTCREIAEFLLDYTTGELDASMRATFDAHLDRCANCREYLANYLATVTVAQHVFDEELARESMRDMPEEVVRAILAARMA